MPLAILNTAMQIKTTMTRTAFLLLIATLAAACGDDTTIITTFHTISGSDGNITFITNPQNGSDGTFGVTDDATGSSTEVGTDGVEPTTFGDAETSATGTTGPAVDTTDTDLTTGDGTTGPDGPVQDPPAGCAHFVEVNGAQTVLTNYFMIDSSACLRGQVMDVTVQIFGGGPMATVNIGEVNGCHIWGGSKSPAATSGPDGTVIAYPAPDEPPISYGLTLMVDGAVSDDVRIPAILKGQTWQNHPAAPDTPIRRAEDFSWRIISSHVPGCDLMPTE